MQAGVGFTALLTYLLVYVGMPDTSHPGTRGVDKEFGGESRWVWLNPFKCLRYMRSPNLLALVSYTLLHPQTLVLVTGNVDSLERYSLDVCWSHDTTI